MILLTLPLQIIVTPKKTTMSTFIFETNQPITVQGQFRICRDDDNVIIAFDNWVFSTKKIKIACDVPVSIQGDFTLHQEDDQLFIVGTVYEEEDEEDEEEDTFCTIDDRLVTIRGEDYPETDDDASVISAISLDEEDEVQETVEEELERQLGQLFVPDDEHDEEDEEDNNEEEDDASSVLTGKPSLSDSIGWQEEEQKRQK